MPSATTNARTTLKRGESRGEPSLDAAATTPPCTGSSRTGGLPPPIRADPTAAATMTPPSGSVSTVTLEGNGRPHSAFPNSSSIHPVGPVCMRSRVSLASRRRFGGSISSSQLVDMSPGTPLVTTGPIHGSNAAVHRAPSSGTPLQLARPTHTRGLPRDTANTGRVSFECADRSSAFDFCEDAEELSTIAQNDAVRATAKDLLRPTPLVLTDGDREGAEYVPHEAAESVEPDTIDADEMSAGEEPSEETAHNTTELVAKVKGVRLAYLFVVMAFLSLVCLGVFFFLMQSQLNKTLSENALITTRMMAVTLRDRAADFMRLAANADRTLEMANDAVASQFREIGVHAPGPTTIPSGSSARKIPMHLNFTVDDAETLGIVLNNASSRISYLVRQLILCGDAAIMGLDYYVNFNASTGKRLQDEAYACPKNTNGYYVSQALSGTQLPTSLPEGFPRDSIVINQSFSSVMSFVPSTLKRVNASFTHTVGASEWSKEKMGKQFFSTRTEESADALRSSAWDISHMVGAVLMKNNSAFVKGKRQSEFQVLVHTLSEQYSTYSQHQPTARGLFTLDRFQTRCDFGYAHTWHVLLDLANPSLPYSTEIPQPKIDENEKKFWMPETATLCVVLCVIDSNWTTTPDDGGTHQSRCNLTDPTSAAFYMVVVTRLDWISDFIVEVMYVIYICAVIMIVLICFLLHVSIAIPANLLHHRIAATVTNTHWHQTKWQKFKYSSTQPLWVGDMKALISAFNLLSKYYDANRRFVPGHILNKQKRALKADGGDGITSDRSFSLDESSSPGPDIVARSGKVTAAAAAVGLTHTGMNEGPNATVDTTMDHDAAVSLALGGSPDDLQRYLMSTSTVATPFTAARGVAHHEHTAPRGVPLQRRCTTLHARHSGLGDDVGMSEVLNATILAVYIDFTEMAYKLDFHCAEVQHRHIYHIINAVVRRFGGEAFHRSGDCFGFAWNAFESMPEHSRKGTNCALELSYIFEQLRAQGMMMGLAVHCGTIISGILTDTKSHASVVFGHTVDVAFEIARLGAKLPYFSVLLTEPVKNAVSIFYVCIIVDVIKMDENSSLISVFEVLGDNHSHATPLHVGTTGDPQRAVTVTFDDANSRAMHAVSTSEYVVAYNEAFSRFRQHDFASALGYLEDLASRKGMDTVIERLMMLCNHHIRTQPCNLPRPYCRQLPRWDLFEEVAERWIAANTLNASPAAPGLAIVRGPNTPHYSRTSSSSLHTPYAPASATIAEGNMSFKSDLRAAALRGRRCVDPRGLASASTPRAADASLDSKAASADTNQLAQSIQVTCSTNRGRNTSPNGTTSSGLAPESKGSAAREIPPLGNGPAPARRSSGESVCKIKHQHSRTASASFVSSESSPTVDLLDIAAVTDAESDGEQNAMVKQKSASIPPSAASAPIESQVENPVKQPEAQEQDEDSTCTGEPEVPHTENLVCPPSAIRSASFQSVANSINMSLKVNPAQFEASHLPVEFTSTYGIKYIRSGTILGVGSYGRVYMGMEEHTGKLVAIKFLPVPEEVVEQEKIENEVEIMRTIHDQYLVDFYGYAIFDNKIALFQECMVAGTLAQILQNFSVLPAQTAVNFIRDVLKGLRKLHTKGIIHRDVKLQNVLISTTGQCKISDFGASASISVLVRQQVEHGNLVLGTPMYLAPEAARAKPCAKSDIWSVGIMTIQMLTGEAPYVITPAMKVNPALFVFQIGSGKLHPTIPTEEKVGSVTLAFLKACLAADVEERKSAAELLEMPFFSV